MSQAVEAPAPSRLHDELLGQAAALPGEDRLALRIGDAWIVGTAPLGDEREIATDLGDSVYVSGDGVVLGVVEAMVHAVGRTIEMEGELEGLYEELGTSYESLSSIYEIGSDPSLLLHPEEALRRIIDRALAFEADLRAVFWLVRDGELTPAQWRNTSKPEPRAADAGLVGRALAEQRGIIDNRREDDAVEPELADARRVAVSPMMCREQAIGALVVWHEAPGAFDSRLMGLLTSLSSQAAMILEQDRLRQETVDGERLRRELEISGVIQKTLLLGHAPEDFSGVSFGTVAHASRQIDGDFFGFFEQDEETIDVLVADVMGKGIPAALVGAGVKSQFLRFAGSRPSDADGENAKPQLIVESVHDVVADQLIDLSKFVTAVYARIEPGRRRMTYVDCGHTEVLHYRAADGTVDKLREDADTQANLPLGFLPGTPYPQAEVDIAPGDCLCFYSDGITEATNEAEEMFGADALADVLAEHHEKHPQAIADAIHDAVTSFASEDGLNDDLTCIVAKVTPMRTHIEFKAEAGHLEDVRSFATEVCARAGADEDFVAQVHLALTEAVTNIVRHAYEGCDESGSIRVEGESRPDGVAFAIVDHGRAFDGSGVSDPSFDGSRDGGFGLFIIDEIMDEVRRVRDQDGTNRLELSKRFDKGNQS